MKKQINPTIKAHLIRGALYLLLLIAVCAIPFALAQRNTTKQSMARPATNSLGKPLSQLNPGAVQRQFAPPSTGAVSAQTQPSGAYSRLPRVSSARHGRSPAAKIAARLLHPLFPNSVYMLDDGTSENAVGFGNQLTNSQALWMNQFDVIPGQTMISTISVAWGTPLNPDPSLNGMPVTIAVWSDPNGDGDPTDGLLLGSVAGTVQNAGTDTFVNYTFNPPVDVSAFTSFFIGDLTPSSTDVERFFQAIDQTPPSHMRSWLVGNSDGSDVDINTLANNDLIGTIDSFGLPGNWLVRGDTGTPASPTPTPTGTPPTCLVVNGGFETGSLPPWTDTGDTSFTGVGSPAIPHSGSFALFSGPSTSDGFIDQTIPTTDGTAYDVSFWLQNVDTSSTNRFGASFGSVTLVPEATQAAFGYTLFTFTNVVPGANADLHFIFYNPPSYFYLDDVCVTPSGGGGGTPTPTPSPSCTPGGSWSEVAAYPFAARGPFVVSDGTFYYTGGGYDGFNVHSDVFKYDPVANTYTPLASAPDQFYLSQAVIFNNKIYSIAGFGLGIQTTTTRIYDIAGNSWTTGTAIPEPNGLSDAATGLDSVGGKIYIACGFNGSGASNTLHIYDINSDSWTTGAPAPTALYLPGAGLINGKFYVASGNNGSTEVPDLQIYDIASDTWSTGAPVPTPVTGPGSAVIGGKLYLFGGSAPFPNNITATQIYDPGTNSWSSGPNMVVPRLWFYGGSLDDSSIMATGGDNPVGTEINDNEILNLTPCTSPSPSATATATATATPTATPTATATATATATPTVTATPTATATATPRPTPTPRPRPITPPPRP